MTKLFSIDALATGYSLLTATCFSRSFTEACMTSVKG